MKISKRMLLVAEVSSSLRVQFRQKFQLIGKDFDRVFQTVIALKEDSPLRIFGKKFCF